MLDVRRSAFYFFLLVFLSVTATLGIRSGTGGSQESKPAEEICPPGETLTFHMKWKPSVLIPAVDVGDLTVRFIGPVRFAGRDTLGMEGRADSVPGFRFPVHDYFFSCFAPDDYHSLHARNLRQEGNAKIQQCLYFYPATRRLWLKEWSLNLKPGASQRVTRNELHWDLPAPLHDVAALIMVVRRALHRQSLPLSAWAGYLARVKQVTVTDEGPDRFDTILGSVPVVKYNIRNLFGNIMDPGDYFYVWATSDQRHIPVRLSAKVRLGHVDGNLTRYQIIASSLAPPPGTWLQPPPDAIPNIVPPPDRPARQVPEPEMVLVPGGSLAFGAGDGLGPEQVRTVRVDPFYIDRCEVTNAHYQRFVAATGRRPPDILPFEYYRKKFNWQADGYAEFSRLAYPFRWHGGTFPAGRGEHPVVLVSWDDACAYARWAGKRLPTEAEWEMAARGAAAGRDYPWGGAPDARRANTTESDFLGTVPAGFLVQGNNPLGISDLSGNVAEWVADWYSEDPFRSGSVNPHGPASGKRKVMRGGDWRHSIRDAAVWSRMADYPEQTYLNVGFRCARDVAR